jgi:membrane protease YdiL (CAAX protease family)
VEEAVFRGGMYRQLRSRLSVLGAAGISALTFGLMHGYMFLLLGPVICLGFVFALMREWRGSLIASMTAHFMHNATTLVFVFLALSALKD